MCKDHWYQTVRLPFYCHFLKWVVKSLRTSSGGSKTSSTTVWRWGRSADSQGGTGRPSLTRLSASAHQSNLFCFLLRVLRVYGLLGLSWRDFNASSEWALPRLALPKLPCTTDSTCGTGRSQTARLARDCRCLNTKLSSEPSWRACFKFGGWGGHRVSWFIRKLIFESSLDERLREILGHKPVF